MGKDSSEIRRQIEETRAQMGDTVEALAYKSDVPARVKDKINDRVDTVKGAIGGAIENVKHTVSGAAGRAGNALGGNTPDMDDMRYVARRGVGIASENPLGLTLGALALGFLGGLLAPVTDFERERVGPIRDDLMEKAQSIGADVIAHGKQVVQETAQAAMQTAEESAQIHGRQIVDEARDMPHFGNGEHAEGGSAGTPGDSTA